MVKTAQLFSLIFISCFVIFSSNYSTAKAYFPTLKNQQLTKQILKVDASQSVVKFSQSWIISASENSFAEFIFPFISSPEKVKLTINNQETSLPLHQGSEARKIIFHTAQINHNHKMLRFGQVAKIGYLPAINLSAGENTITLHWEVPTDFLSDIFVSTLPTLWQVSDEFELWVRLKSNQKIKHFYHNLPFKLQWKTDDKIISGFYQGDFTSFGEKFFPILVWSGQKKATLKFKSSQGIFLGKLLRPPLKKVKKVNIVFDVSGSMFDNWDNFILKTDKIIQQLPDKTEVNIWNWGEKITPWENWGSTVINQKKRQDLLKNLRNTVPFEKNNSLTLQEWIKDAPLADALLIFTDQDFSQENLPSQTPLIINHFSSQKSLNWNKIAQISGGWYHQFFPENNNFLTFNWWKEQWESWKPLTAQTAGMQINFPWENLDNNLSTLLIEKIPAGNQAITWSPRFNFLQNFHDLGTLKSIDLTEKTPLDFGFSSKEKLKFYQPSQSINSQQNYLWQGKYLQKNNRQLAEKEPNKALSNSSWRLKIAPWSDAHLQFFINFGGFFGEIMSSGNEVFFCNNFRCLDLKNNYRQKSKPSDLMLWNGQEVNHWANTFFKNSADRHILGLKKYGEIASTEPINRGQFLHALAKVKWGEKIPKFLKEGDFDDISQENYYYNAVYAWKELGVIQGASPRKFAPERNLTRAEAVKIILSAKKINPPPIIETSFDDLEGWALPWVEEAFRLKIVQGVSPRKFAPERNLTRAEAVKLLMTF
jgi:hypothetical protein